LPRRANACTPEDCGGTGGYADPLEALANSAHEEHEHYRRWTGEEFNPEAFDLALTPRSSASADQFTISGVELSISWLAVRLIATNLVVTRR
jgi:Plasmid pRiA4b ORF-3-like protein